MTFESTSVRLRAAAVGRCALLARLARHIDVRNPLEIDRCSRELGITRLQLLRIVDRVGTDLRAVRSAVLDQRGVTWH